MRYRALITVVAIVVLIVTSAIAQEYDAGAGIDRTYLGVMPVEVRGISDVGTGTILTDMLVSACVEISDFTVVELRSVGTRSCDKWRTDYRLEATAWSNEGRFELIITLHDDRRRIIVDSTHLSITPGGAEAAVQVWRDDIQVALRRLSDERLSDQTAYLYAEGNTDLAWEYALRASLADMPVEEQVEQGIRYALAAEHQEAVSKRRLPDDTINRITNAVILSPGPIDLDRALQGVRANRTEIRDRQVDLLAKSVSSAVSQGKYEAAEAVLAEAEEIRAYAPERIAELRRDVADARRDDLIAAARSRLRRQDENGAQRYLVAASLLPRKDTGPDAETVAALTAAEETILRRRYRDIRFNNAPDPLAPRMVRDRAVWASVSGQGSGDPEERYGNEGVELTLALGASEAQPLIPYLRLYRRAHLSVSAQARTTRVDALLDLSPAFGTQFADLSLGVTGGVAYLGGRPEIRQGGFNIGISAIATAYLPGRLQVGLYLTRLSTLWIPDLYLTPLTTIGIRVAIRL